MYLTHSQDLASTYGGGPTASVKAGTRAVHGYQLKKPLFPEDAAYIFGGKKRGEEVRIVSGNGIEVWRGPWSSKAMEDALQNHAFKIVIGTPDSIGLNQIAVRDKSILAPLEKQ